MTKLELTPDETITLYFFLSATLETMTENDLKRFTNPNSIDLLTTITYKIAMEMDQQINKVI